MTEGILTLSACPVDRLRDVETVHDLPPDQDAATRLVRALLCADQIISSWATRLTRSNLRMLSRACPCVESYLEELITKLRERHKRVTVEHL